MEQFNANEFAGEKERRLIFQLQEGSVSKETTEVPLQKAETNTEEAPTVEDPNKPEEAVKQAIDRDDEGIQKQRARVAGLEKSMAESASPMTQMALGKEQDRLVNMEEAFGADAGALVGADLDNAGKNPEVNKSKTHFDMLFNNLGKAGEDIKNAEGNDKMKEVVKAIAIIAEILRKMMDGTLFDEIKEESKREDEGKDEKTQMSDPEKEVREELSKKQTSNAAETKNALKDIQRETNEKFETNKGLITSLTEEKEDLEASGEELKTKKTGIEDALATARRKEGDEAVVVKLEVKMENIQAQIDTNKKSVTIIDEKIACIKEENENLEKKFEAAKKLEGDFEKITERLKPILGILAKAMSLDPGSVEFGFSNGKPVAIIQDTDSSFEYGTRNPETGEVEITPEQADAAYAEIKKEKKDETK